MNKQPMYVFLMAGLLVGFIDKVIESFPSPKVMDYVEMIGSVGACVVLAIMLRNDGK